MDPEGELETLNIKLAEEEAAIQHGLNPLLKEVSVVEDGKKPAPKVDEEKVEEKKAQPEKKKKKLKANEDIFNIILLLILYILQGIPSGLTFSVPLILSTRNVSYSDQGTFSFALWPFSIRLLWAPIVDSLSIARIGRRKTWVVGCFIAVGLIMVSFSQYVHNILQADREKNSTDIYILTLIFGTLVFLIATQDIALDAWSLDLLMHKNVGWQSICNSVGIGMGGFMGGALFLTLESVKFSNQFIRPLFKLEPQNYGVFTIKQFCYTFGIVSIVTGLLILFFKSEHSKRKLKKSLSAEEGDTTNALPSKRSILINYKLVWSLLKLNAIRKLIFIFLTVRIGFASEHVVRLKLVELGVEREKISILSVLIAPILTVLPFVVKKYINGPKPLDLFRSAYVYKMLMLIIVILFTYYVPYFKDDVTGAFTYTFYIIFFVISLVSSMISFVSWVSVGGFCAKISDKTIGGTYLTFLGFWLSLGSNWSKTACLYLISWLTFKQCVYIGPRSSILANNATSSIVSSNNQNVTLETAAISNNKCSSNLDQKKCTQSGGYCITTFDGFYIISLSLLFIALLWLILTRRMIDYLQILPKSAWCVSLPTQQSTPTPTSLDDDESDDNNEAKKTNKK